MILHDLVDAEQEYRSPGEGDLVGDAALADASQVAIQGVVNEKAVRTLPIVSRNLYNLSLQAPGVKGPPSSGFGTTQLLFGGTNRSTCPALGTETRSSLSGVQTARRGRGVRAQTESVHPCGTIARRG